MTREEAITYLEDAKHNLPYKFGQALDMAIESLKAEPIDTDLISRADAIKTFIKWGQKEFGYSDINREERFIDAINTLPSADNHGEWDSNQSCSICGCQPWYEHDIHTLRYCPNCGARMKGGVE